jgi:peptidoglycan/xylan/chitin deacetylase (PgdA/CDA1 family)
MKRWIAAALFLFLSFATAAVAADQKLIALTFDDGPRPYILYGYTQPGHAATPGLLDLLDREHVKATFFVMGWRLTPGSYGDRREFKTDKTCLDAARDLFRRGHEIEDHTFSHVQFKLFEKQHGAGSAVGDVDRASELIKGVTGHRAEFVRPPDWITWDALNRQLEGLGYRVLSISSEIPLPMRDVNSADYLCAGAHPVHCPKPSLNAFVLQEIEQREKKGVTTHILAFHELSTTVIALETLLPELKARGYRLVTMQEYVRLVGPQAPAKGAAINN